MRKALMRVVYRLFGRWLREREHARDLRLASLQAVGWNPQIIERYFSSRNYSASGWRGEAKQRSVYR